MTSIKKDFYGKEVADAIKKACDELGVPQEQLEINVIETGSTGIFGLIRKKAHITAFIKEKEEASRKNENSVSMTEEVVSEKKEEPQQVSEQTEHEDSIADSEKLDDTPKEGDEDITDESIEYSVDTSESDIEQGLPDDDEEEEGDGVIENLPEESLLLIKDELSTLLDLMGYASPVEVSAEGASVLCHVGDEFEDHLTGQEGKTLDSLQYLLRKIVARKIPHRLRLTVDVGNYREKRILELKEKAIDLAAKVKAHGKTQVIPALSPSERRVIHMSLQDDKDIRSRSVGDGLFKKILIYKPGKGGGKGNGKGNPRRRGGSRGRKNYSSRKKNTQ